MSFFPCDCVRLTPWDHTKWCNMTAHEFMDDCDHDGCDGHDHGDPVHCTDYCVDDGDQLKCTMCGHMWVKNDDE